MKSMMGNLEMQKVNLNNGKPAREPTTAHSRQSTDDTYPQEAGITVQQVDTYDEIRTLYRQHCRCRQAGKGGRLVVCGVARWTHPQALSLCGFCGPEVGRSGDETGSASAKSLDASHPSLHIQCLCLTD